MQSQAILQASVKGNTMAEYALIGVLVLSTSMFALMAFGNGFSVRLGGVGNDADEHIKQAKDVASQMKDDASMSSFSTIPGMGTGQWTSVGDSMANAQTTGANGDTLNTGLNGNTVETDSEGNPLTPQEAELKRLLQDLSNHAHQIAQLENMLNAISQYSNGNKKKFQSTTIYYAGRTVNAYQLAYALTHGGEIVALEKKKQEILDSSASTDIKDDINSMANEVMNTAKDTGISVKKGSTSVTTDPSTQTNKIASNICKRVNGNGNHDNGNRCGSKH